MFPLNAHTEHEMRARALFINAADAYGPVKAGPLEAADDLLPGFDRLLALVRDSLTLPVVSQFNMDGVALAREQVTDRLVVDLYEAHSDTRRVLEQGRTLL